MGVNVTVDEKLIEEAERLTGEHDHDKLVEQALCALIKQPSPIQGMLDLVGKVRLRDDYDHKAMRAGKSGDNHD